MLSPKLEGIEAYIDTCKLRSCRTTYNSDITIESGGPNPNNWLYYLQLKSRINSLSPTFYRRVRTNTTITLMGKRIQILVLRPMLAT